MSKACWCHHVLLPILWKTLILVPHNYTTADQKRHPKGRKNTVTSNQTSSFSVFSILNNYVWLTEISIQYMGPVHQPLISCNPSWAPSKSGHLITCTLPPDAASWADKGSQPMIWGVRVMLWIKWRGQRTPGKCPQRAITNLNMQQYVKIKYLNTYM